MVIRSEVVVAAHPGRLAAAAAGPYGAVADGVVAVGGVVAVAAVDGGVEEVPGGVANVAAVVVIADVRLPYPAVDHCLAYRVAPGPVAIAVARDYLHDQHRPHLLVRLACAVDPRG